MNAIKITKKNCQLVAHRGCSGLETENTAAAFIAGALHAERLFMMTDIAGILRDKDDPSTLIPHKAASSPIPASRPSSCIIRFFSCKSAMPCLL